MATFTKRKNNTFERKVDVICNDQSMGTLSCTFERLKQSELQEYIGNDVNLLTRVLKNVGTIPVEDSDEVLEGAEALALVLEDASAVACCALDYYNAMKGGAFRGGESRKVR